MKLLMMLILIALMGFSVATMMAGRDIWGMNSSDGFVIGGIMLLVFLLMAYRLAMNSEGRGRIAATPASSAARTIAAPDRELLERLWSGLERMEQRITNLETILMEHRR